LTALQPDIVDRHRGSNSSIPKCLIVKSDVHACALQETDAFARLMNEKLENADINTRNDYIRSIIDAIEVDDKAIRIIGSRDILQAAIADKQVDNGNAIGFVRKWRATQNNTSNSCTIEITT
jgi:hypothetical protein